MRKKGSRKQKKVKERKEERERKGKKMCFDFRTEMS